MKLKIISAALLLILSGTPCVLAEAVMTVNGSKVEKTVARISFAGDDVKVTFSDDCVATFDMEEISFLFVPEAGINSIPSFNSLNVSVGDRLEITGLTIGSLLQVYDLNGMISVQEVASGDSCCIDISHLEGGVYMLKVGNEIVKFIKR